MSGAEFRPDNRRIVHHAAVFLDPNGVARRLAAGSSDGGYPCFGGPGVQVSGLVAGWAPGTLPPPKSQELSQPITRGTDLVLQIHYHPSGKPEQDQSSLGLSFSGPPSKGRASVLLFNHHVDIPPGESHYVVKRSLVLPRDVELAAITPHAHYLGKNMKVNAYLPDGSVTPLIWIKDWDFNWQGNFQYTKRPVLPKGTRIEFEYTFDNSENNPRNPSHPPVRVTWGEETRDEMAVLFLGVVLPSPDDVPAFQREMGIQALEAMLTDENALQDLPKEMPPGAQQRVTTLFKMFDKNGDGKLDADERAALEKFLQGMVQ